MNQHKFKQKNDKINYRQVASLHTISSELHGILVKRFQVESSDHLCNIVKQRNSTTVADDAPTESQLRRLHLLKSTPDAFKCQWWRQIVRSY